MALHWNLEFPDRVFFANLRRGSFRKTSDDTDEYNCIAYAYGLTDRTMWPAMRRDGYWWPSGIPNRNRIPSFVALFASIGYEECDGPALERGFEKVAIYARGTSPTHAARQLTSGRWTSKLGEDIDIQHDNPD